VTEQTGHVGFGGRRGSEDITRSVDLVRNTILPVDNRLEGGLVDWLRRTLNACKTHNDAVMAFVVAIAGIILPAISLEVSNV
jgi:hypothetical protein